MDPLTALAGALSLALLAYLVFALLFPERLS
jgi:K+-transporting ATPase KdpF subunit